MGACQPRGGRTVGKGRARESGARKRDHEDDGQAEQQIRRKPLDPVLGDELVAFGQQLEGRMVPEIDQLWHRVEQNENH